MSKNNGAFVLNLEYPFDWGSDRIISELTIRRPKTRDLKTARGKNGDGDGILLLSTLTGEAVPVIEELDAADFMRACEVVEGFLPSSRKDGDSGSEPSPGI